MNIQLRPTQKRGVDAMKQYDKGQIIVPTGGGKTLKMIYDCLRELQTKPAQTIVVVAPRILLAEQLCSEFLEFIINAEVIHVHSGETSHYNTTKPSHIKAHDILCKESNSHQLIFTTYNSLQRVVDSGIDVDTIYFDEAHNSVKRNFFPATEYFSSNAKRCYFFTATRKTSQTLTKPGMNDREVYGDIICRVTAPELVDGGYIVAPKIVSKKFEVIDSKQITSESDNENLMSTIDETDCKKILVVPKQLANLPI